MFPHKRTISTHGGLLLLLHIAVFILTHGKRRHTTHLLFTVYLLPTLSQPEKKIQPHRHSSTRELHPAARNYSSLARKQESNLAISPPLLDSRHSFQKSHPRAKLPIKLSTSLPLSLAYTPQNTPTHSTTMPTSSTRGNFSSELLHPRVREEEPIRRRDGTNKKRNQRVSFCAGARGLQVHILNCARRLQPRATRDVPGRCAVRARALGLCINARAKCA